MDRDSQLDALRKMLNTRPALSRLRGRLSRPLAEFALQCLGADSCDETARELQRDFAEVLGAFAEFRAAGWEEAESELWNALTKRGYRVEGETLAANMAAPYTVFAIDPAVTFFLANPTAVSFWPDHLLSKGDASEWPRSQWPESVHSFTDQDWTPHRYMPEVCGDPYLTWPIILRVFSERLNACKASLSRKPSTFYPNHHGYNQTPFRERETVSLEWSPGKPETPVNSLFFGSACDADKLVSCFAPDAQVRLACWQFDLPQAMKFGSSRRRVTIGIYPEAEQEIWRKKRPVFCSVNTSHGVGALIIERYDIERAFWQQGNVEDRFTVTNWGRHSYSNP